MKLKKIVKIIICVLFFSFCILTEFLPQVDTTIQVQAAKSKKMIKVSKKMIQTKGASKAIQEALYFAKKKATAQNKYCVLVPKGTYKLEHSLYIYSNTELNLTGVTLVACKNKNIIHVGSLDKNDAGAKGYCYKNIKITGGVLDGKNKSGTLVKVGHASNFSLDGVTVRNTTNSHLMEVAGVKGLKISNCKFMNQISTSNTFPFYEAIQLDVLYPNHMSGYRAETINTTDVLIEKCSFTNVPRGIGSHTSILNQKMNKITIRNCKFSKMDSVAIQGLGWRNCTIENNVITDSPRGICYYDTVTNGKGTYLPSVVAKMGKTNTKLQDKYQIPLEEQNFVIRNNKITLNGKKDPYSDYERVAILVSGKELEEKVNLSDHSGNLPLGNYYPSGVLIEGNIIKTTGHGVRVVDSQNVIVKDNHITGVQTADKMSYHGIQIMSESKNIQLLSNDILQSVTNGIYVNRNSNISEISGNLIRTTGKYGIDIEESIVKLIVQNEIEDVELKGIFIFKGSKAETISMNQISHIGDYGIHVSQSIADQIRNNKIISPGRYGIMYSSNSRGELICGNEILNATVKEIHISSDSVIGSIQ